jgi:large subunit ribosomal protein L17
MVTSLLQHERITTTDAKAKELRPIAEKMITLGKRGDLHAVRQAAAYIRDKKVVTKLFETIAPRFKQRQGGYTRIVKLGLRPGDNADVSILELVEEQLVKKPAQSGFSKRSISKEPVTASVAQPVVTPAIVAVCQEVSLESTITEVAESSVQCEAKSD